MTASQVAVGLLAIAIAGFAVWGYPRRYFALSGRSRLFRTAGMGLLVMIAALGFVYLTAHFVGRAGAFQKLSLLVALWGMALSLVLLAMLDALESFSVLRREERSAMERAIQDAIRQKNAQ